LVELVETLVVVVIRTLLLLLVVCNDEELVVFFVELELVDVAVKHLHALVMLALLPLQGVMMSMPGN